MKKVSESFWKEQGIGDDIIFLGLVPEAKVDGISVYVDPRSPFV